jgi:outer membrane protein TolC
LRVERDLREAERVLAHLRGLSLDEAAQALKDHAVLVGTSVIEVARELLAHRPVIRPRVLRRVTDLESWAATGRGSPRRPHGTA